MSIAVQVVLGPFAVLLTALGSKAMFAPAGMLDQLGVESKGALGLNSVRGMVGGLLVGTAAIIAAGLITADTTWFLAAAVLMAVAGFGRIVGMALDGFVKEAVRPTVIEFVVAGLLVGAHFVLGGAG